MYGNANNALLFLIDTLFALYIIVVLLRILLQLSHADFFNPISQFVWQITDPPVRLLSYAIPQWRNFNVAALVLALILAAANVAVDMWFHSMGITAWNLTEWSVLKVLVLLCNLYFFTILVQVLVSWLSPGTHSPASAVLWSLNEPLLRPIRQYLPPIGGLDISPLVVMIGLQVVSRLLPLPGVLR